MNDSTLSKNDSPNSFYRFGDIDILTFAQDEDSKLWKIYLSTTDHYVVSREFDKSHGMYANAPEEIIRRGLMDFSATIMGKQLSIFDIMDMFIDRCFNDYVFDSYTTNAVWMCIDCPSYEEMEEITSTYGSRIIWFNTEDTKGKNDYLAELLHRLLYKTPPPCGDRTQLLNSIKKEFEKEKIVSIYLNRDSVMENVINDSIFDGMPIFIGEFNTKNGESVFKTFKYIGHC